MNKIDYNKMMKEEMSRAGTGARLLLHGCCGPCSTRCLETLKDIFKVSVLFYNPNITDAAEYEKRKSEQERLLRETGWADILTAEYEPADFSPRRAGWKRSERAARAAAPGYALRSVTPQGAQKKKNSIISAPRSRYRPTKTPNGSTNWATNTPRVTACPFCIRILKKKTAICVR